MSKEGVPNFINNKFGDSIDSNAPTNPKIFTRNELNDLNFINNKLIEIRSSIAKIKESSNLKIDFAKLCNSISGAIGNLKEKGFIRNYEQENREFFELRIKFLNEIVDFSISKIKQNKEITKVSETFKSNFKSKTPDKIALLRKEILITQFEKDIKKEEDIKSNFEQKINTIESKFGEFFGLN